MTFYIRTKEDQDKLDAHVALAVMNNVINDTWVTTGKGALRYDEECTHCMICREEFSPDEEVYMMNMTIDSDVYFVFHNDVCNKIVISDFSPFTK